MAFRVIKSILKVVLAIITYQLAIFFYISRINKNLDFCPIVFHDAIANMKCIPFFANFKLYFSDFWNMTFPLGFCAAFTEIPFLFRTITRGLGGSIMYELENGRYDLVNVRAREVVGHGDDGPVNALYRIIGAAIIGFIMLGFMFFIKPLLIIWYIIKIPMAFVDE